MSDQRSAWKRIHAIADKSLASYKAAILSALDAAGDRLDLDALADAIEAKDLGRALRIVKEATLGALQGPVTKATRDLVGLAGADATAVLEKQLRAPRGEMRFDVLNPRAIQFVKARTAEAIKYVTDGQKGVVRAIVRDGFEKGRPPREMAALIREHIGVLPDHESYLLKEEERLREKGASDDEVERHIERELDRLLDYRAEMVARTETIVAAYQGARESWRQAEEADLLPAEATQEWIVADDDRLCEICEPLDGRTAKLDEEFAPGIEQPGDPHPGCRCGLILRPFGVTEKQAAVAIAWVLDHRGPGPVAADPVVVAARAAEDRVEAEAVAVLDALRGVAQADHVDATRAGTLLARARDLVGPAERQPALARVQERLRADLNVLRVATGRQFIDGSADLDACIEAAEASSEAREVLAFSAVNDCHAGEIRRRIENLGTLTDDLVTAARDLNAKLAA